MKTSQVKELNDRIENIRTQRTKAETRREMLLSTLKKQIEEYENTYGVKLGGSSYKATLKAVQDEKNRVESSIREEYEMKLKVVEAIESGDIDTANKLLGIVPEIVEEEDEPVVEQVDNFEEPEVPDVTSVDDTEEDGFDFDDDSWGVDDEEESKKNNKSSKTVQGATPVDEAFDELDGGSFELDEDDDDDFGFGSMLAGSKFDI